MEELSLLRNGLVSTLCLALLGMCTAALIAQRGAGPAPVPPVQTPAGRGEASPASQRAPQTKTPQSFPPGGRNSYRSVAFVTAAMPLAALAAPT